MKSFALALALAGATVPAAALACDGDSNHSASAKKLPSITVAEVAKLREDKAKFFPVDANPKDFRASQGVIPGALQLTSLNYDLKELPANKDAKLVFYCASEKCTASDQAAQRAIEGGYTNVSVLPGGIIGWKKAGQPTARANNS